MDSVRGLPIPRNKPRKFYGALGRFIRQAPSPHLPAVWSAMGCWSQFQKRRFWSDWPGSRLLCTTSMTIGCAQRAAGFTGREPISTNSPAGSRNSLSTDGERARLACSARRLAEPISSASRRRTTPGTGRSESRSRVRPRCHDLRGPRGAPTRSRDMLPETRSAKFRSPEFQFAMTV